MSADRIFGGALLAVGLVAFLLAPFLAVYAIGAFGSWDMVWIAGNEFGGLRSFVAVIQVVWIAIISIAVSGS